MMISKHSATSFFLYPKDTRINLYLVGSTFHHLQGHSAVRDHGGASRPHGGRPHRRRQDQQCAVPAKGDEQARGRARNIRR